MGTSGMCPVPVRAASAHSWCSGDRLPEFLAYYHAVIYETTNEEYAKGLAKFKAAVSRQHQIIEDDKFWAM